MSTPPIEALDPKPPADHVNKRGDLKKEFQCAPFYLRKKDLKSRGWTDKIIDAHLVEPDHITCGRYADSHWYYIPRVEAAEAIPEIAAYINDVLNKRPERSYAVHASLDRRASEYFAPTLAQVEEDNKYGNDRPGLKVLDKLPSFRFTATFGRYGRDERGGVTAVLEDVYVEGIHATDHCWVKLFTEYDDIRWGCKVEGEAAVDVYTYTDLVEHLGRSRFLMTKRLSLDVHSIRRAAKESETAEPVAA